MIRIFNQYISLKSLLLLILEGSVVVLAVFCGVKLRFWRNPGEIEIYTRWPDFGVQIFAFVAIFIICFYYSDFYRLHVARSMNDQIIYLGQSIGAACIFLGVAYYIFPELLIGQGVFFISTALAALFVFLCRLTLDRAWQVAAPKQNVAILGTEELGLTLARELTSRDDLNIRLCGFIHPVHIGEATSSIFGHPILGSAENLEVLVQRHHISKIVVAMTDRRGRLPIRELVRLRVQGIRVEDAHSTISSLTGRVWLPTVQPSWFVFSDGFHRSKLNGMVKRSLDLVFGISGLVLAAPIMALVAVAIRLDSAGPILFWQTRVGLGGKCFNLVKFRSMRVDAENGGAQWAQKNDPRVSRVGRFLRKYRLDELPQLLNVARGEMSFVGPRPERPVFVEQLRKEISYYDERHSVRPGLTGWAQVQYPYGASREDAFRKLEYDLFYLKNMSLVFDFVIILQTIRIVLTGFGAR